MENDSLEELERKFQEQLKQQNPIKRSEFDKKSFHIDLKYEMFEPDMDEVFRQFDNKSLTKSSFIRPVKNDRNRKFGQIIY